MQTFWFHFIQPPTIRLHIYSTILKFWVKKTFFNYFFLTIKGIVHPKLIFF